MTRRTVELQIIDEGRDKGKMFLITEMSAFETEKWANRLINAILRNSREDELIELIPLFHSYINNLNQDTKGIESQVKALKKEIDLNGINISQSTQVLALNFANFFFKLPYEEFLSVSEPLLECCKHFISYENKVTDDVINNINVYIEEAPTIYTLKKAAFALHTDFFIKAVMRTMEILTAP